MEKQITVEKINSLLDEFAVACKAMNASGASAMEVRARILYAFKFGYDAPEIPTDPDLNRI